MRRTFTLLISAVLATACAVSGVVLAWHYPIAPAFVIGAFLLWIAVGYRWRFAWLVVIPALLPICGLATWTGWFAFEELDLLVLGAAAAGYAGFVFGPEAPRRNHVVTGPSPMFVGLVLLFAASCGIALYRGIASSASPQFDWIGSYESAMNSARLFKSFASALLLWPLLRSALDLDQRRALDSLVLGFALGLGGASLAALWERAAFTEVLNFSSDYRTTALFWEMHVGGAALDGFLALTVPFAVWELRHGSGVLRSGAALTLSGLAAYACLTTFSRGVYLAVPVSLGCLWLLSIRQKPAFAPASALSSAGKVLALAIAGSVVFYIMFRFGGYRALAAFIATLGVAMHVAGTQGDHRLNAVELGPAILIGLLLAGLGGLIAQFIPKGQYVVFAIAFVCNAGYHLLSAEPLDSKRMTLRWALLVWLAAAVTMVALHWGGTSAFVDSVLAVTLLLAVAAANRLEAKRWVPETARKRLVWLGISVLLAAGVTVFAGGAYMGDRFSTSSDDLETRTQHWGNGTSMLRGAGEWWVGKGFGSFPGSYFFDVPDSVFPGSFSLHEVADERYLSLAGPRHPTNWGDLFRVSQRVPAAPGTYTALLDIRSATDISMHLEVCEQHLLYNGACGVASVPVHGAAQWQQISTQLDARTLSRGSWYAPRLAFFSMAVGTSGKSVDIRAVTLIGPDRQNLLVNGDFSRGMARWIPISERYHLPWHIKNIALDLIFDQGIVGLVLFFFLLLAALGRLTWGRARSHPLAPYLFSALVGFIVVGVFDSLLDVPRVAFLFYLVLLASLTLPAGIRSHALEPGLARAPDGHAQL